MISKKDKFIILMPPKTASTSLSNTLRKTNISFSIPNEFISPLSHLKLDEIVKIYNVEKLEEYKILQVVRNPYQRFISAYFQLMRITDNVENIKFKNYNLNKFTKHLYDSKKSENFLKNFYGDTSFVETQIKNNAGWGGSGLFDTQLSWKNIDCKVTYFKLENISNDISPISNFINLPINSLDLLNSTGNKNYLNLIDDEMKLIIKDLFDEDIKSFQYLHI
jgi:mannose/fructose/N-acetylgalactosamine-specific phosphotransferase system component IIB